MPKKSDDFEKTLELQTSNIEDVKNRLIVIDNKMTNMITVFKIFQISVCLLIILIVAYFIFKYY